MTRTWVRLALSFTLVTAYLASPSRAGSLLMNPSFEVPPVSDTPFLAFQPSETIGLGWVVVQTATQAVVIPNSYQAGQGFWPTPTDGSQFLYVGDNAAASVVYQDIALSAGTTYRLEFDLASFLRNFNGNAAKLDVDLRRDSTLILGGPMSFSRPLQGNFAAQQLEFTVADDGTYRLTLNQIDGYGANVDNFSLVAVPEPSTLFLAILLAAISISGSKCWRRNGILRHRAIDCISALLILSLLACQMSAEVIYSNLGNRGGGGYVVGEYIPDDGTIDVYEIGTQFVPVGYDYQLSGINAVFSLGSGTNSMVLSLHPDAGGFPANTTLESWSLTNLANSPSLISRNSTTQPTLEAGERYWLKARMVVPTSVGFWWANGYEIFATNGGTYNGGPWANNYLTQMSVEVDGISFGEPTGKKWVGDQATCDGVSAPSAASFHHGNNWQSGIPDEEDDVLFGVPSENHGTINNYPRHIYFGDFREIDRLPPCSPALVPGGPAAVRNLRVLGGGAWVFDFASNVGDMVGSLNVSQQTIIGDVGPGLGPLVRLRVENGPLTSPIVRVGGEGIGPGVLEVGPAGAVSANLLEIGMGGVLAGTGTIHGNVLVREGGTVGPGFSTGELTIDGDFEQMRGSSIELEISGTSSNQFDRLNVVGSAAIGGELVLDFRNGFAPQQGDVFELFSVSDELSLIAEHVRVRNLADGFIYDLSVVENRLSLTALNDGEFLHVPGDTNYDGYVDLSDLNNVRNNFGASGGAILGDANLDGKVDLADLNAVRNNFGAEGSLSQSVPEPATFWLCVAPAVAIGAWRNTRGVRAARRLSLATICAVAWLASALAVAAPVQWTIEQGGNGHWYDAVHAPSGVSWFTANDQATGAEGHLVTITSAAENQFVFGLINSAPFWRPINEPNLSLSVGPWLGGYQPPGSPEPTGGWRWVTDEPFTYQNWLSGEPNNSGQGGAEGHLQFFTAPAGARAPTWNDATGSVLESGYIVEWNELRMEDVFWVGNQSGHQELKGSGSFFHGNNWLNFNEPGATDNAIFGSGVDPQQNGTLPHYIYFGDYQSDFAEPASDPFIPGGTANVHDMPIQSGQWTFDFGHNAGAANGGLNVGGTLTVGANQQATGLPGNAAVTVTGPGELVADALFIADAPGGTGVLEVVGGDTHLNQDGGVFYVHVGSWGDGRLSVRDGASLLGLGGNVGSFGAQAQGVIEVQGAGSEVTLNNAVSVGFDGHGEILVSDGGTFIGGYVVLGERDAASSGVLNVSGANSSFNTIYGDLNIGHVGSGHVTISDHAMGDVASSVVVGNGGEGTLAVSSSAQLSSQRGYIAAQTGSVGEAILDGADTRWTITTDLHLANSAAAQGALFVRDGARLESPWINVGAAGQAEFSIENGGVAQSDFGDVGNGPDAIGSALVTGTDSAWNIATDLTVGRQGEGKVAVSNGGLLNVTRTLFLGNETSNASGELHVSNGANVRVGDIIFAGFNGSGRIELSDASTLQTDLSLYLGFQTNSASGELHVADGANVEIAEHLRVGSLGSGLLEISDAAVDVGLTIQVGRFPGSHGVVHVGAGGVLVSGSQMRLGRDGSGELLIEAGGRVTSGHLESPTNTSAFVGDDETANAIGDSLATVTGVGSTWDLDGYLVVGRLGNGTLRVEQQGRVNSAHGRIGMLAGGVGVVEARSQGEWQVANSLYVGGGETGPGGEGLLKTSDDGRISVGSELHLFDQGSVDVMGGRINVGQGDLPAIGTLRVGQNGTLSGTGEILGNVLVDGGTLIPGDSPGVLSISGDLDHAAGLLEFEIGGPMAGLDHDQLVVGGVASLRSVVRFEFIDGFTPSPGQLFQMVAAGDAVNSQFAQYDFVGIPDQLQLSAVVADGVLSFLDAPLIGDTNHDGTVGLNDLNNVRNNFGLEGAPILGDTNLDGRVDLQDLNNVRNNFGTSALHAVPEPAGWQLAGMLIVIALSIARLYGARG